MTGVTLAALLISWIFSSSSGNAANGPKLPYVDKNACPFECCQLGDWKAVKAVKVYTDWRKSRRKLSKIIPAGMNVKAVEGVFITYKPGMIRVRKDLPDMNLHRGEILPTYLYTGEGYMNFWSENKMKNDQISSRSCKEMAARDDEPFCELDRGQKEWWVRIETASGSGWVEGNEGFDGTDACG